MGLFGSIGDAFSSITKTITKPITSLFGGSTGRSVEKFLFGSSPSVKGYATTPQQEYAYSVLKSVLNDPTPYNLKSLSDTQKSYIESILNKGLATFESMPYQVETLYNNLISEYSGILNSKINDKTRALGVLGLLNTPMAQYTTSQIVKEQMLPIMSEKTKSTIDALYKRGSSYYTQANSLSNLYNWYAQMQMLPIETRKALAQAITGTSGQPIIQQGSSGVAPNIIQGGVSGLVGAIFSDIRLKYDIEDL